MKTSVFRLVLISAILIVLVGVSGGIYVKAQSGIDQGPIDQGSDNSNAQPIQSSSALSADEIVSNTSALDPNAISGSKSDTNVDDADVTYKPEVGFPQAAVMRFLYVTGTAFHPRNSTYTYAESASGGCLYQVAGSTGGIYVVDLQLPEGALVDLMRLFWYDTSASDSQLFLSEYAPETGGLTDITYITSNGTTGFGNNVATFSYTVANYDHPILLNWRSNQLGSTMMLCGVRLRYWVNGPLFLPSVIKP